MDGFQQNAEPPMQEKAKRHHFKKTTYSALYLPKDHRLFKERVTQLYHVVQSFQKHQNKAWWADCCHTMIRNTERSVLGHPKESLVKIKDFIVKHFIYSEQDLLTYLEKNLPRHDDGHYLLPTLNMMHGIDAKKEEFSREESGVWEPDVKVEPNSMPTGATVHEPHALALVNEELQKKVAALEEQVEVVLVHRGTEVEGCRRRHGAQKPDLAHEADGSRPGAADPERARWRRSVRARDEEAGRRDEADSRVQTGGERTGLPGAGAG
jgi:hypothetical protein